MYPSRHHGLFSKTYFNAKTPPPLPGTAEYPGHAFLFLLEEVRAFLKRKKWNTDCRCAQEVENRRQHRYQKMTREKNIHQINYQQRGLGLQIRKTCFLQQRNKVLRGCLRHSRSACALRSSSALQAFRRFCCR